MQNLETAVRERNRAYFELETGETGERPGKVIYDPVGKFILLYSFTFDLDGNEFTGLNFRNETLAQINPALYPKSF